MFALPFALTGALLAWRDAHFRFPIWQCASCGSLSRWWARVRRPWRLTAFWMPISTRAIGERRAATPAGLLSRKFRLGIHDCFVARVSVGRPRTGTVVLPACSGCACILFFYSFSKRFTTFRTLCSAFVWAWLRPARGLPCEASLDPRILWLTAAVHVWTAGFDIIYACQDYEFDCTRGTVQHSASDGHSRGAAGGPLPACPDDRMPACAGRTHFISACLSLGASL